MDIITLLIYATISYVLAVILGPIIINYFTQLKVKQIAQEDGLESHLVKTGTPMMGAFIFLPSIVLVTVVGALIEGVLSQDLIVLLLGTLGFALVGFLDDYRKVIKKENEGLTAKEKLIGQFIFGIPLTLYICLNTSGLWIPFTDYYLNLGIFMYPFVFIAIIATTNAVNLTDGVDGLSTSVTILVMMFFTYVALKFDYPGYELFTVSIMMALFGFLMFNKNPARIFMGDVGSLALGGAVVTLAGLTNTLLLIFIVGIIYFAETVSVTLQVLYFKKTGKRIFKMAPLHHHYELVGWSEKKIVRVFSTITLIGVIIGVASLGFRG
jgi:phospho-N-acetylmuramoyl-pentapeptide-transferase